MVISSVGDIDFNKLVSLSEKYFRPAETKKNGVQRVPFSDYNRVSASEDKDSFLTHAIMGNEAYPRDHKYRLPLAILTNLLGGPALNSRLNLSIREKHGYAYAVEATYQPYSDTGVVMIYVGSDKDHIDQSLKLINSELNKLRERPLGTIQLHRAKQQVIGQLAISFESRLNEMLGMAKNLIHDSGIRDFHQLVREIEGISSADLQQVANEIFDTHKLSSLIYKARAEND
jgi:predicted Zn-dependent peptidase